MRDAESSNESRHVKESRPGSAARITVELAVSGAVASDARSGDMQL